MTRWNCAGVCKLFLSCLMRDWWKRKTFRGKRRRRAKSRCLLSYVEGVSGFCARGRDGLGGPVLNVYVKFIVAGKVP
jgi:hypothetical protein